jgi:hypothetical protein
MGQRGSSWISEDRKDSVGERQRGSVNAISLTCLEGRGGSGLLEVKNQCGSARFHKSQRSLGREDRGGSLMLEEPPRPWK